MKIGLVIYGSLDTLSGGYLYDRKLVEYLRAQGDTVEIISLPWRNYAAHLMDNLWFRLPGPPPIASAGRAGGDRPPYRDRAKQSPNPQKFDILIQDELNHPSLLAANRRPHPCPIVSLVHHLRCSELRPTWQNAFYRVIEKKYLQSVDGFIFNSQTTKNVVNGIMDRGKPSIVAYPPTDRFGDAMDESTIIERGKKKELRILFLGNVIERKGLHTLLQALFILHPSSFIFDIVGSLAAEPAHAQKMQDFVRVNGLSSIVHFHGALDREALAEKFRNAHLLVVPSSYEGYGIVYLEGMGFGLPAIGTTAGAAKEIIEHGKTGYLIEPNDPRALASLLSQLAADRNLLTQLSLNARQRYIRQPSWEQTAANIRSFLLDTVRRFPEPFNDGADHSGE
jgi:glycosyltransferase involved in cell wall biosynthesis